MIQGRMVQHLHNGVNRTSLGVVRTVNQTTNARVNHGSGTHCARFNCSKQITVDQAVVAHQDARFSQRHHFSMRGWIASRYVSIPAPTYHFPTANDHRSYWDFSYLQGSLRAAKGFLHPEFVVADVGTG